MPLYSYNIHRYANITHAHNKLMLGYKILYTNNNNNNNNNKSIIYIKCPCALLISFIMVDRCGI